MKKWWAIGFAAYGYAVAVWYYANVPGPFPAGFANDLFWLTCFSCLNIFAPHSSLLKNAVFRLAPINALLYAGLGFLVGKIIEKFKTASNGARSS